MKSNFGIKEIKWEMKDFPRESPKDWNISFECESSLKKGFIDEMILRIQNKFNSDFNKTLELYLRKNLNNIGIIFNEHREFYSFINERIEAVKFPNGDVQFWLNNNIGIAKKFVGSYNSNSEIFWTDKNTITAVYGRNFEK